MTTIITYFVISALGLSGFYLIDRYVMRHNTQHHYRRAFYLVAWLASALVPAIGLWLNLSWGVNSRLYPTVMMLNELVLTPAQGVQPSPAEGAQPVALGAIVGNLFLAVYWGGILVMIGRWLVARYDLWRIVRTAQPMILDNGKTIIVTEEEAPFSYGQKIYVPRKVLESPILHNIIIHEEEHILGHHQVDFMLGYLVCTMQWWNPFAHLLFNQMRINHEYLADVAVLQSGSNRKNYQYELLYITTNKNSLCAMSFAYNNSNLKKRIKMMNSKQTSKSMGMKYILTTLPLIGLMFIGAQSLLAQPAQSHAETMPKQTDSIVADTTNHADEPVYIVIEKMPEFPGGVKALQSYLASNMKYPESSIKRNMGGRIIVSYTVYKTGKVGNIKIVNYKEIPGPKDPKKPAPTEEELKQVQKDFEAEAIRIVNEMPDWKPGEQDGKPVNAQFTLPITFRIK